MCWTLTLLGWIVCAVSLVAAPLDKEQSPVSSSTGRARLHQEAQAYGQALTLVLTQVRDNYVRPIAQEALAEAALAGLYETAQLPVPSHLRERLRRADSPSALLLLLTQVRENLGTHEALQGDRAILASCRALLRVLDPYCAVVQGAELRQGVGEAPNYGVGLVLAENLGAGPLLIKSVLPGGPAQKAGLRGGDWITHIDGEEIKNTASLEALLRLNGGIPQGGPPEIGGPQQLGGRVRLTVRRDSKDPPLTVTLERCEYLTETVLGVTRQEDNTWDYWLDRPLRIAQVRLVSLGRETPTELRRVLDALNAGPGLGGLILDLRWCPGGLLNESVEAARLFLEEGVIVKIKTRTEEPQVYRAGEGTRYIGFPMVVLLNGETSGGAELIAAALQDHDRAWVAGQRSRGKANIQKIMGLPLAGAGLRLTIGTFQRPCGQNLHRFPDSTTADDWGVCPEPELELRLSPDLTRQLRQWWQEQTDRPGQATRVLPLDDLTADPQRHAALQALRRKIRNPKSEIRNPKSEIRNPKSP